MPDWLNALGGRRGNRTLLLPVPTWWSLASCNSNTDTTLTCGCFTPLHQQLWRQDSNLQLGFPERLTAVCLTFRLLQKNTRGGAEALGAEAPPLPRKGGTACPLAPPDAQTEVHAWVQYDGRYRLRIPIQLSANKDALLQPGCSTVRPFCVGGLPGSRIPIGGLRDRCINRCASNPSSFPRTFSVPPG